MKSRILTVSSFLVHGRSRVPSGYYEYPCIIIRGRWLEKCGFVPGAKYTVCEEKGCLKLKLLAQDDSK